MTVQEICTTLDAKVLSGTQYLSKQVHTACGSDMLSDVLAFVKDQSVLLTGLCNLQVLRTAEMMDIICLVFVRGKEPDCAMLELAKELGIVILSTNYRMFTACGLLYEKGLRGGALE